MILENGFGTPKSKMVSEVLICFFRKSNVILKRLLGYVFSYIEFANLKKQSYKVFGVLSLAFGGVLILN